jgi:hypothetical protein
VTKKKSRMEKTIKKSTPVTTGPDDSVSLGIRNQNRADTRVKVFDLKRSPLEDIALVSKMDIPVIELRNGKTIHACLRKVKQAVPRKTVNDRHLNLGSSIRRYPLKRISPKSPPCGKVSALLKQRTDESFRFLTKCQGLLKGTTFETEFIYLLASSFLKHAGGLTMCYRTPSLGATRLILQQIIRCRSNFPWERIMII